jgi:hypothetical protein
MTLVAQRKKREHTPVLLIYFAKCDFTHRQNKIGLKPGRWGPSWQHMDVSWGGLGSLDH